MSSVLLSKRSYGELGKSASNIAKSYEPLEFYMTLLVGWGYGVHPGLAWCSKINVFWFLSLLFSPWAMVFYLDTIHAILYTNDAIFNVAIWTVTNSKLKGIIHLNSLICLISRC